MGRLRKPSLFAVVIAVAMLQSSDHAESAGVCDEITKSALVSVLSEIGGNVVDPIMTVSDALLEYFTNPDDKRLSAALSTLVEGGTSIVFPAYGVAIGTGRGVHNATNFTVDEMINSAQSGQIQAFICGGPSVGNLFSRVNFFDLKAMKGINCDNFNDKVTTFAQLEKIKALWFGYYARQLGAAPKATELASFFGGSQGRAATVDCRRDRAPGQRARRNVQQWIEPRQ